MDTNKLLPTHQTQRNWHTPSQSGTRTLAQSVDNIAIDEPVDLSINADNVEPSIGLETERLSMVQKSPSEMFINSSEQGKSCKTI